MFSRRIYTLSGQGTYDEVRKKLQRDPEFARTAQAYMAEFEQLLKRAAAGPRPAQESRDYLLSDRGTWLSFKNRGELAVLTEGDKRLFNQYGVMLVNPVKHPNVKAQDGQAFVDWLVSPQGQATIAGYKVGGEQLFFPNASH